MRVDVLIGEIHIRVALIDQRRHSGCSLGSGRHRQGVVLLDGDDLAVLILTISGAPGSSAVGGREVAPSGAVVVLRD